MRNPEIQRIIDAAKQKKYQAEASKGAQDVIRNEAKGLMQTIQDEQTNALRPVFEALGASLVREVSKAVSDAIKGLKVDVPKIDSPQVNIPDIHIPPFNIPTPKVTVNVPKQEKPNITVTPTSVIFPEEMRLKPNAKPFPVIMMDQAGKPMLFPQQSGSATGGKGDFFTIQGFSSSIGASIIDSSGVSYSGSNPVPVTFGSPIGQGDGSAAIRVIQAGDSISSTNALQWNGNTISTNDGEVGVGTLRIVHAADIGTSVNIVGNIATLDIKQSSGFVDSINLLQIGGTAIDTGSGASSAGSMRIMLASDANLSTVTVTDGTTNIDLPANATRIHGWNTVSWDRIRAFATNADAVSTQTAGAMIGQAYQYAFNGSTFDRLRNSSGEGNALRIQQATDSISSIQANNVAMTTLPTAAADAGVIFQKSDKLGRTLNRPVNVRELLATAYASITTGTEVTLLTATAGQYLDLIYAMATNNSDAAVTVDLRSVSAGNIETSIRVPANGTAGISLPVPIPQSATGNAWTADLPDITGTTVTISALFSKES